MFWMMAAQVGMQALSSHSQGKVQAANARASQADDYTKQLLQTQQELKSVQQRMGVQSQNNQAIAKADIQSLINTNYMAGLLNVQRGVQKAATAKSVVGVGKARLNALSSAQTSAAASGTIGASVNAVASDIQQKAGQAILDIGDDWAAQEFNFETQVHNLYEGYRQSQVPVDTSVADLANPAAAPNYVAAPSLGSAIGAAAVNVGGNYLNSLITLDLGKKASRAPVEDRSFMS